MRFEHPLVATWVLVQVSCVLWPTLSLSETAPRDLTRYAVYLALAGYATALAIRLTLSPRDWETSGLRLRFARTCWILGCASYLIHVLAAFYFYHGWSHAAAVAHVESESGFGHGIWFSYLFTVTWLLDALAWLAVPGWYAAKPAWVDWAVQGYLAFIVFNGTVVFETSWIRWVGIAAFAMLAILLAWRLASVRSPRVQTYLTRP